MIRAAGFDLWETLITNSADVSRRQQHLRVTRLEQILAARGYGGIADRIERAHRDTWTRCQDLYWSVDVDVPCRRQVEHFLEALELDPATFGTEALDELEDAYASVAVEILPQVTEGAQDVLSSLKAQGLALGMISNTGRTPGYALREILQRLGLAQYFDVMVFSNEHGACKPQQSIFDELRRGLDVRYDEMLFVGDNLHVDVLGAQRCGIRAIHFIPPRRGVAVAPPVENAAPVVADATITDLRDVIAIAAAEGAPLRSARR
jgi:putative hydrolase of the HAD superfamily